MSKVVRLKCEDCGYGEVLTTASTPNYTTPIRSAKGKKAAHIANYDCENVQVQELR